jgi:pimeloyl-ACP methyl ester carboxylesterase
MKFQLFKIKPFDMKKNLFSTSILLLMLFCLCACDNRNSNKSKQDVDHAIAELKTVFINGDSISYMDIGKGEPVVFVHGTVGDYRVWGAQMDTFAINHRVIAYSRRFAYPNKQIINDSADYSVTPHAKDLAQFIKMLDLDPVHLVGHSYGAYTSLLTAMEHPELLRSLTLGEPPVIPLLQNVSGGDTLWNNFVAKAIIPAAEAFKNNNNEKGVEIFIGGVLGDSLSFSKTPQLGQDIMMDNTLELRGIVFNENLFPSVSCDDIKKLMIPVLLITGDRSPQIFTSIINELDSCLNNNELAILSNSSHGLELDNPLEFNEIVLDFINKH